MSDEEEDLPECFGSGPYLIDCQFCEWTTDCQEAHDEGEADLEELIEE